MNGVITDYEAMHINNAMPVNQYFQVGEALRIAQDGRHIRKQDYVFHVDGGISISGDGKSWGKALKTITDGIIALNSASGKGATLVVAPGFYIEKASSIPNLTASDCLIQAIGLPEDTVLFGSGVNDSVTTADDHLIKIKGGNNIISGLGLYVHKNDKACIHFDDTGAGYAGSFNIIRGCYFSPQAQDGVGYGIYYLGGNAEIIEDNIFYGAKTAAIFMAGNVGNPVRNIIRNNQMIGTALGIKITCANYNTLIDNNWFSAGSQSGEDMTNAIEITTGMNAGKVTIMRNFFEQSNADDILDNKTGGSVIEMDNVNGA